MSESSISPKGRRKRLVVAIAVKVIHNLYASYEEKPVERGKAAGEAGSPGYCKLELSWVIGPELIRQLGRFQVPGRFRLVGSSSFHEPLNHFFKRSPKLF